MSILTGVSHIVNSSGKGWKELLNVLNREKFITTFEYEQLTVHFKKMDEIKEKQKGEPDPWYQ